VYGAKQNTFRAKITHRQYAINIETAAARSGSRRNFEQRHGMGKQLSGKLNLVIWS
jgi:hypothetical protein